MGLWEGRGKVVATGIGTSPTARRWDEKPETSMGAMTIIAIRKAIADAGISPDEIDGLVLTPDSTTGVSKDPTLLRHRAGRSTSKWRPSRRPALPGATSTGSA